MTLTTKEAAALLNLSESSYANEMDITYEELYAIQAKLRAWPARPVNAFEISAFETRMIEATAACNDLIGVRLEVIDLGVRVVARTGAGPVRECALICPWITIATCHINPLLSTIKRVLDKLESGI